MRPAWDAVLQVPPDDWLCELSDEQSRGYLESDERRPPSLWMCIFPPWIGSTTDHGVAGGRRWRIVTDRYHVSILVAPAIVESSSRCAKLLDENRTEGQAIDGLDRVRPGIVGLADSGHCSPSAQLGPIQLGLTHLIRLGSCTPSGRIHGQQSIYISCARASCSLRLE